MSDYSIWLCEYGYVPNYPRSGLLYGAHNQGHEKLPYYYAVIHGKGHVAMVDVGFNLEAYGHTLAQRFGAENWHSPHHVLAKCGLTPEDVDTVLVTHCHFDHFGNAAAFPNATFYVQEREIAQWVWVMSLPERMRWMTAGLDPDDIVGAVELVRQGRLKTVDGAVENVLPGIDLHPAFDTHTFGSMYVNVRNDGKADSDDNWIIAGDLVYSYDNIEGDGSAQGLDNIYVPIGLATGSQTNLVLITEEMMKRVSYEKRRVIPVHEERVKDEFPSRLDEQDGLRIVEICLADGQTSRVA